MYVELTLEALITLRRGNAIKGINAVTPILIALVIHKKLIISAAKKLYYLIIKTTPHTFAASGYLSSKVIKKNGTTQIN